jgi:aminoglycoside phosphotransferase (APT) family kinase protein
VSAALELPADLAAWLEQATGDRLVHAHRIPGGGVREGWFVDFESSTGERRELFLRCSQVPLPANTAFHSLACEAQVVDALGRAGATVPRVHASHPSHEAVLLERVAGDTWFSRIEDADQQLHVARDFIRCLAATHRLDPDDLGLDDVLGPARSAREIALDRIAELRRRGVGKDGTLDPVVQLSADWLEANVPDYEGPVVLVQGDTGPGNFLYRGDHVTAVLDWELCHWGDPMDDLAWLTLRAVQDTFTHVPDRLREYAELCGHPIDVDRIWYYRVFAETTMATLNARDLADDDQVRDSGTTMIYHQLHRRLWIAALDHVMGLGLAREQLDLPHNARPDWDWLYQDADAMLKEIGGRVEDPLLKRWNAGVLRAVRHLRERATDGPEAAVRELAAIEKLLPGSYADLGSAREALADAYREGSVSPEDYVRYLWPVIASDDHMMRTASGVLATRTWPPLIDKGE